MADFDLTGQGGVYHFDLADWHFVIELGEDYGWKPEGTSWEKVAPVIEPTDEQWDEIVEYTRKREKAESDKLPEPPIVTDELPDPSSIFDDCDDSEKLAQIDREDHILGDYFSNSGQWVTEEDAISLSCAIENALDDIPNHDAINSKDRQDALPRRIARLMRDMPGSRPFPSIRESISAKEWFSGEQKNRLNEFIAFCRQGGFQID